MEVIEEVEPERRGLYAGCVGYFDYHGNMDTCIALRTLLAKDGKLYVQAGGGDRRGLGAREGVPGDAAQGGGAAARDRARGDRAMKLLVIDNYDSFTYNLVQYLGELGATLRRRAQRRDPRRRGRPARRRRDRDLARAVHARPRPASASTPSCVTRGGCRSWASAWATSRSARPSAGGSCTPRRSCTARPRRSATAGSDLFAGLPSPFEATRYHSLAVAREGLPERRSSSRPRPRTARSWACATREHPVFGVQFHPESILTRAGQGAARELPAPRARRARARGVMLREALARAVAGERFARDEMRAARARAASRRGAQRRRDRGAAHGAAHARRVARTSWSARPRRCASWRCRCPRRRRTRSTPAAPAATARTRSTSRRSRRSWSRARACRWRSTATAPPRAAAAAPSCSRRSASRSSDARAHGARRARGRLRLPLRARVSPGDGARSRRCARRSASARSSTGSGRSRTRCGVRRQLVGVAEPAQLEPMAAALVELGAERVWVVHSEDGLDEISLAAPTRVLIRGGGVREELRDRARRAVPARGARGARGRRRRRERAASRARVLANEPGPQARRGAAERGRRAVRRRARALARRRREARGAEPRERPRARACSSGWSRSRKAAA